MIVMNAVRAIVCRKVYEERSVVEKTEWFEKPYVSHERSHERERFR